MPRISTKAMESKVIETRKALHEYGDVYITREMYNRRRIDNAEMITLETALKKGIVQKVDYEEFDVLSDDNVIITAVRYFYEVI